MPVHGSTDPKANCEKHYDYGDDQVSHAVTSRRPRHLHSYGGSFIDTANSYRNGESEEWLGKWMALRKKRDDIVLAMGPQRRGRDPLKVALDASLEQLQTSYIYLYYVHWWDYSAVSWDLGFTAWVVSKANDYARQKGLRQFVVYQGLYNATVWDFERDIIPMCHEEGMGLAPWAIHNQGRFQTEEVFREREKHNEGRNANRVPKPDRDVSKVLKKIATKKGVDLLHVALAYAMDKAPIAGLGVSLTFEFGFPHSFLSGTRFDDEVKSRGADQPADGYMIKQVG
ncbi:NADP-dependent oxidoreductase domain-containing protein [Aspergillus crustosus]